MSADNGIYIAKFPDGYRVAHTQNIEDINYFPVGSKKRKEILKAYFGKSNLYIKIENAVEKAHEIATEILNSDFPILEYGIQILDKEYENFLTSNKKSDKETEEIEITLDEQIFLKLAILAHKKDITFNQLCIELLEKTMNDEKNTRNSVTY